MADILQFPGMREEKNNVATVMQLSTFIDYEGLEGALQLAMGLEAGTIHTSVPFWRRLFNGQTEYHPNDPRIYGKLTTYQNFQQRNPTSTIFNEALLLRHAFLDIFVHYVLKDSSRENPRTVDAALTEKTVLEKMYGPRGIPSNVISTYLHGVGLREEYQRPVLREIQGGRVDTLQ